MPKRKGDSSLELERVRHSLAHLLAAAVLEKFPKAKLGVGPVIEDGFYYDFDLPRALVPEDLSKFESRIEEFIKQGHQFSGKKISAAEGRKIFRDQPFKLELIKDFVKEKRQLSIYKTLRQDSPQRGSGQAGRAHRPGSPQRGSGQAGQAGTIFTDLCRGGHVKNTKEIDASAFKLDRIAGAYWKGDEKNPQLQRIYGLAFGTKKELDGYLKLRAEAEKRDHKKLGTELELFMFHQTAPGMPYWLPKGVILYNKLVEFWRKEHESRGYQEISSPILNKKELYITSGHYDHYWPEMFVADMGREEQYGVKSMNCPNAMIVFGSKPRSYRSFPLRFSDTDSLHRYERSGVLNGLLRVREFRQDDAHIFVSEDQIETEYREIFKIVELFYSIFDIKYEFRLGTRPKSFLGDIKTWNRAEKTLEAILKKSGKKYSVLKGDGAFYGPKVDILMKDAIGRQWQMGTIQLDFHQPRRFRLKYTDRDGSEKTPIAIHRVVYGSLERFIGILIEHCAGAFPTWLSPVQVQILAVSQKHQAYASKIHKTLVDADVRAELTEADETLGKRIREGETQKLPYLLIVGEKEQKTGAVAVRKRGRGDLGVQKLSSFIQSLKEEINRKK
jgi:threonyl-tRNA synthetase